MQSESREGENLDEHIKRVRGGLTALREVFAGNAGEYRVVGSALVAALYGKPHRKLGDIDMLVDAAKNRQIIAGLIEKGYTIENKSAWGFRWQEAYHRSRLGFTFLLVGTFGSQYFSCVLRGHIELRISNAYIKPMRYSLLGIEFIGIPRESVYQGIKASFLNPKRTLDRKIMKALCADVFSEGEKLDASFQLYLCGIRVPYAYTIFSHLYNLYGGIRVRFGKKYEAWE